MSKTDRNQKPLALKVCQEKIPGRLKEGWQFVVWRWEWKVDRWDKPPRQANGSLAKVDDPETWCTFAAALDAYATGQFDGIGRVMVKADGLVGVDRDCCVDYATKTIDAQAQAMVDMVDSYTELSPSGSGLRTFALGELPAGGRKKGDVELYDSDRYLTLTGHRVEGQWRAEPLPSAVMERREQIHELHQRVFGVNDNGQATPHERPRPQAGGLTAYEILELARDDKNAAKWDRLMRGELSEYNGDDSRADGALCALAAFYTRDAGTIDQIVRMSGLCRLKWTERPDYRERTIAGALDLVTETYTPSGANEIRHAAKVSVDAVAPSVAVNVDALPDGVTTAGRARLYDLSTYRPELEATETDWMIRDWLVRGQIHQFVGEEKRGKSTQQWRRIAAVSRGDSYLGSPARKARVLAITEMGPDVVRTLLDDDDIEPDWSQVRLAFVDEIAREDRLGVIGDAVKEWAPTYLTLDPIDECFGLDESGVFNPAKTADAFEIVRQWANQGTTIDALYHYNNQGKIANSYKFRAKPDHIYRIRGTEPADVTYEYQGRVRAIPRKRRIAGNGDEGYQVTLISGGQGGRPAKTRQLIQQALEGCIVPLSVVELSKRTDTPYQATKQALLRAIRKGELEHIEGQGYRLKDGYGKPPYIPSRVSYPSPDSSSKDRYETPLSLKEGSFVPAACGHLNVRATDDLLTCLDCGRRRHPEEEWPA